MDAEALRTAALLLATVMPGMRQEAAPPPVPAVVFADGTDRSREAELNAALKSVARRFPALTAPELVKTVVITPGGSAGEPDCGYDDVNLQINLEEACLSYPADPGLYRAGSGLEPLFFHELIHAWHILYEEKTGADVTFLYELGTGGRVGALFLALDAWRQTWVGPDADYVGAKDAKERELVGILKIPRRTAADTHAADHPGELFAYAGEFHFYAASPDSWLTPAERAYWTALGEHLAGRGPVPAPPKTP